MSIDIEIIMSVDTEIIMSLDTITLVHSICQQPCLLLHSKPKFSVKFIHVLATVFFTACVAKNSDKGNKGGL